MTPARRRELEQRIAASRRKAAEPWAFTHGRGIRPDWQHRAARRPPVYTSIEDGPGARPRVRA